MNNRAYKSPSEVTSQADFNKTYSMIVVQAELRAISWGKGKCWDVDPPSLRKLRAHQKKIQQNLDKLSAWAGRVRPREYTLYVARYIYNQMQSENVSVLQSIEELSALLAGKEVR